MVGSHTPVPQQIGGTIIFDYFISMDYTTYIKIICDYIAIIPIIFLQNFNNDYTQLLHYLQKTIISLIALRLFHLLFSAYIMAIIKFLLYHDHCDDNTYN